MAKIAYVKAYGLWSHFESTFEFSPGLTVVTGPNDSGKSSLIRIIKWVALGEPSGEAFIFTLKDEATGEIIKQSDEGKAEVGLDNGLVITKTRRKGKTTYTINTIAEPFEKAEVPQEVKDALGIQKHTFGDFEAYLNFAFQQEAPFLLSESPSVGAKVLGKLAGTETVDLGITEISKRTHKARDDKRIAEKEVERINGDLLEYQDLDDLKQQLEACEYLVAEIDQQAKRRDNLKDLDLKLETARESLDRLEEDLLKLAIVPDLEIDLQNVEKAQQRYDRLLDLFTQLNRTIEELNTLTDQLELFKGLDVATNMLTTVEANDRRLTTIKSLSTNLLTYTQNIIDYETFLVKTKDLDVAAANMAHMEKQALKLDKLKSLRGEHTTATHTLLTLMGELKRLEGTAEAAGLLETSNEKIVQLEALQQLKRDYTVKDTVAKQAAKDLEAAILAYATAEEEVRKAWEAAGGICPLCEGEVPSCNH